ncbi:outer membrane lipoprotein carrier protein LolA [Desulfurobacterium thermolithotrophum DSM 11699]|uniref:Outer membrane lipoprotein carrier protein LolA n=1 Tax=Desulfurobacterium thermolithotrophum (strain DSM 11699 / BSA) TaxID=868864 RepID=F0S3K4_DESTD|nr:outer membrane lipoprotein carrier protein LolA [Desulfurobacterium thermolithotrophum]ADY73426.1 outer membrane lipoprotein carrier protein LolA [Desulfurobacterium thermolithotrophum DSM 11699]
MKKILSSLVLTFFFVAPAYGDGKLDSFLEKLKSIKTLKIVFSQETKLPVAGDTVDLYGGVIYYEKPSKFRWEYTKGSDIYLVSNGEYLETVFPSDNQCQITELDTKSELFPLFQILNNPENFKKLFKIVKIEESRNFETVELKPTYENSIFEKIILLIDKDCNLKAFKTVQIDKTFATYVIKSWKENVKLSENLFKITPCSLSSSK